MNEKDPQPTSRDYVDVLEELKKGDFFDALAITNDNLQNGMSKEDELYQIDTLNEIFGREYINGTARIFAELHQLDMETGKLKEGEYLSIDAINYQGFEKRKIDGVPVMVCEFYDHASDTPYYVDPRTFLQIEVSESDDLREDMQQLLKQHITSTIGVLHDDTFLQSPYEEQVGLIDDITKDIANDMDTYFSNLRVDIDCKSYYHFSDNDLDSNLDNSFVDQSAQKYEERITPSGTIIGCALLEQLDTSNINHPLDEQVGFTSESSYYRSGGIPCLIVRDSSAGSLYFVQLDAIRNITCDDLEDDDDDDE